MGTAGGLCQAHPSSSSPPAVPVHPGVPIPSVLPGWVQEGRAVGGQEMEPGRLRVRGWALGWHRVAWGGGRALTYKYTRAKVREY